MTAQLPQPLPPHPQIWLEGEKNRGRVGAEEGEEGGRQDSEGGRCFVYVLAMKEDEFSSFKTGNLTAEHERTEALLRCLVQGEGWIERRKQQKLKDETNKENRDGEVIKR